MYLFLYFRQPLCIDGIQAGAGAPVVPVQHQSDWQDTTAYENNTDGIQLVGGRGFLVWAGAQKFLNWSVKNHSYLPKEVKAFMFYIFNFFYRCNKNLIAHIFTNRLYAQYFTVSVCTMPPNILQQCFPTFLTPHTNWAIFLLSWLICYTSLQK